jgi:hypothetical protein
MGAHFEAEVVGSVDDFADVCIPGTEGIHGGMGSLEIPEDGRF